MPYLQKVKNSTRVIGAPFGMTRWEFLQVFCIRKLVPWLSCGVRYMMIGLSLALLIKLRLVTDRQSDTRTDGHRAVTNTLCIALMHCKKKVCR